MYQNPLLFPGIGAAFIDIGGGTSDISIWQNNKLLLPSSIRLSGDQIILDPF
jgi:cell division ATPase FtsA